tara:strand:- start:496 stop:720 length:225 start_codon:yes stop_codon:yes gene_type:complete
VVDLAVSRISQDQQLVVQEEVVLLVRVDIHLLPQVVVEHWHLLVTIMILVLAVELEMLMEVNPTHMEDSTLHTE